MERCPQLKQLTVFNASLSVDDFARLAQSPVLTSLSIHQTNFSDAAIEQLSQSTSLCGLAISGNISEEALAHLTGMPNLDTVSIHTIGNHAIGDLGLKHLSKIEKLRSLNLGFTTITDKGLACIDIMPNLKYLSFFSHQVSPQRRIELNKKFSGP